MYIKPLTKKQQEVLNAIKELIQINLESPTLEEIRKYMGYKNTSSVQRHIDPLIRKGYLENKGNVARGLSVINRLDTYIKIPLVGNVACGMPIFAEENIEAYIPYPKSKTHYPVKDLFFLRARGDSMNLAKVNNKNIENGDYVLIHKQNLNEEGKPIVVLIGDEATIKYLKKDTTKSAYVLYPSSTNSRHKIQLLFKSFLIQGVVIDVIKPNL
jgi:SOS regulatory protein LexA